MEGEDGMARSYPFTRNMILIRSPCGSKQDPEKARGDMFERAVALTC